MIEEIRKIKYGSSEYFDSVRLREKILRKPLGLAFTKDFLQQDKTQFHIGAFDKNKNLHWKKVLARLFYTPEKPP